MIGSDTSTVRARFVSSIGGDPGINFAGTNRGVFKVNTNDSGFYVSGSFVTSSTFIWIVTGKQNEL